MPVLMCLASVLPPLTRDVPLWLHRIICKMFEWTLVSMGSAATGPPAASRPMAIPTDAGKRTRGRTVSASAAPGSWTSAADDHSDSGRSIPGGDHRARCASLSVPVLHDSRNVFRTVSAREAPSPPPRAPPFVPGCVRLLLSLRSFSHASATSGKSHM